jgi:hypothetical protein
LWASTPRWATSPVSRHGVGDVADVGRTMRVFLVADPVRASGKGTSVSDAQVCPPIDSGLHAVFLAANAHFWSNWTSRVLGGEREELVVGLPRVLAGRPAVAPGGVAIQLAGPAGLADATALGDVLQDRRQSPPPSNASRDESAGTPASVPA